MKAAEITDQKGLEAWLGEQPKDVCVWIAARAAARVLPLYWHEAAQNTAALDGHLTALPICRALLTASSFAYAEDAAVKEKVAAAAAAGRVRVGGYYGDAYHATAVAYHAAAAAYHAAAAAADGVTAAQATIDAVGAASAVVDSTTASAIGVADGATFNDACSAEAHGPILNHPLWPEGMPDEIASAWQATLRALPEAAGDQPDYRSFWVPWYQGLLDGKPAFPRALTEAVALTDHADWKQGDLHINNTVIPALMAAHGYDPDADGSGVDESAPDRPRPSSRIRTVRAQVVTLQDFLDAEVEALRGHNERSPVEDDILEVLKDLKALVDQMIERLDDAGSDARAVTVVNDDLPAIVEKTGELAVREPEPEISPSVATMAVTIKALVDAGGDPKLATQFAMGEAANRRLWPRIRWLFGKGET